ncbi:MAG: dipeptide ABC transporter ATP-binding protein [Polyangiaceae bacterium]
MARFHGPSRAGAVLGFDYLGHDVWSRVLAGGRTAVTLSVVAAVLAWLVGTLLGLLAGYSNRLVDQTIVWCADSFHAFPSLILVLLVVSMFGRAPVLLVALATLSLVPGVIRLARSLTQAIAQQEFVEAAELLGHSRWRIRLVEILPNALTPLLVHFGTMLSWAVSLLSALSFLGYGIAPPAADWGLMINENRPGISARAVGRAGADAVHRALGARHQSAGRERRAGRGAEPRKPSELAMSAFLRVEELSVRLESGHDVVSQIGFSVASGEVLALVGESGSGKTTIAMALLGYARAGARIASGRVWYGERDLLSLAPAAQRSLRGPVVAYVSQDSGAALNPALCISDQLAEVLIAHEAELTRSARVERIRRALGDVGLPNDPAFLRRYPHQLSGGQQQRVLLALAFVLEPRVVVLDEPTTALDVTTQASVLTTVRALCSRLGTAVVYVSHDLSVVRELADRVLVLYGGRIAEKAPTASLFTRPAHPYSRGLLGAVPELYDERRSLAIPGKPLPPSERPPGCAFAPRCERRSARCEETAPGTTRLADDHYVACFSPVELAWPSVAELAPRDSQPFSHGSSPLLAVRGLDAGYGARQILFDVQFELERGECLALVGESGSGKTTLARAVAGLGEPPTGKLVFDSAALSLSGRERTQELRRRIQYVFQNPYRSLNPRHTVAKSLRAGLDTFFRLSAADVEARLLAGLERVGLPRSYLEYFPAQLSGGERQRVAILRALLCEPKLLICDEVTSSLDVSVQAAILELIRELKRDGISILFVTHNLSVVRAIADRVAVLEAGKLVELGSVAQVLGTPQSSASRSLLRHARPSFFPASSSTPP